MKPAAQRAGRRAEKRPETDDRARSNSTTQPRNASVSGPDISTTPGAPATGRAAAPAHFTGRSDPNSAAAYVSCSGDPVSDPELLLPRHKLWLGVTTFRNLSGPVSGRSRAVERLRPRPEWFDGDAAAAAGGEFLTGRDAVT